MDVNAAEYLPCFPPQRQVVHAEALGWLSSHPAAPRTSVITSLPDISEVPQLGFSGWRTWFVEAARHVLRWVPADGVTVFFQSDIRHEGVWVDKSFLIMTAAASEGMALLWHKIVCRKPPGAIGLGRPTYSHMLCFARTPRVAMSKPGPDVLADAGHMPWNRAMGETACKVACRFLRDETPTRVVVDPFCGEGSVLAVANALGFDAVGVDLSARRCRVAETQTAQFLKSPALAPLIDHTAVAAALLDKRPEVRAHGRRHLSGEERLVDRRSVVGLIEPALARCRKNAAERAAFCRAAADGALDLAHGNDPTNRRVTAFIVHALARETDPAALREMVDAMRQVLSARNEVEVAVRVALVESLPKELQDVLRGVIG